MKVILRFYHHHQPQQSDHQIELFSRDLEVFLISSHARSSLIYFHTSLLQEQPLMTRLFAPLPVLPIYVLYPAGKVLQSE